MSQCYDNHDQVVIVGAGLAGLFAALKLAPIPTTVISPAPIGNGASSAWAQGGVAAAIDEGDTPEDHARDTIAAGAGLVNEAVARLVAGEAAERIDDLIRYGVPFDKQLDGKLSLSREAAPLTPAHCPRQGRRHGQSHHGGVDQGGSKHAKHLRT